MKKLLICLGLICALCIGIEAGSGRSSGGFSSSRSSSGFSSSRSSSFGSSRSSGSSFSSGKSSGWGSSSSRSSGSSSWGSSSKSSSSKSSSSWGGSSSSSGWGSSSSKPSSTSGFWSNSTTHKTTGTTSDSNVYTKAKQSGLAFSNKTQAESHFKTTNASKYTTKFSSEPKTRPTYIPSSTSVGGKTVNIAYNQGYGGYGYMHPVTGAWMMYDVMSDAVMMSMLMNNHGYYVGHAPVTQVYHSNSIGPFIFIIIAGLIGVAILVVFLSKV